MSSRSLRSIRKRRGESSEDHDTPNPLKTKSKNKSPTHAKRAGTKTRNGGERKVFLVTKSLLRDFRRYFLEEHDPETEIRIFPWYSIYILLGLTMWSRINIASSPDSWWMVHPDEVFQSLEVAHSETYGYGFRPYEFFLPPSDLSNNLSNSEQQHLALGMYSMRSWLYPRFYQVLFWMREYFSWKLRPFQVGKSFELLNCDDHKSQLKKLKRDPSKCRPDITHQCLLMLLDSPLNRAGLLQVYVHTERNALIEINPQTRIPRTYKRFSGLMVQLLHKLSIRAADGPQRLLKVIKNPISDHLPVGCKKIGTSFQATKVVNPRDIVPEDDPVAIVIGAMAHGKVNAPYIEEEISISEYPLSAALTCTKFCSAFEEVWGVR